MGGFSGGRGGGGGSHGSFRGGSSFSSGRSYSHSSSSSYHPQPHGPYGIHGPRAYFWGPRWFWWGSGWGVSRGSFFMSRIVSIIIMFLLSLGIGYGAYSMHDFNKHVATSTYVVSSVSNEKHDSEGYYYTYTLSYDYNGNNYTGFWDYDYNNIPVGYSDVIYVNTKDPTEFDLQDPSYSKIGILLVIAAGGLFAIGGAAGTVSLITHTKEEQASHVTEY